jgi:preprotein translocase subunit SecB
VPRNGGARVALDAVTPVRVYLVAAELRDVSAPGEAPRAWDDETEFETSIALHRPAARKLTVALTVESGPDTPIELSVTCAADFEVAAAADAAAIDATWERVIFEDAPSLLYPYVRSEISRLVAASRAPALVLPFIPLPIPRPDAFVLPSPPDRG